MDNNANKDLNLKLMCKLLFRSMGYTSHYEIKLRNKSYINSYRAHDVSDIDVFGYFFNRDLSIIKIGAECKSGESSALDEFYKFLGVSKYYGLDKAYLFKTKIHQNARQIALDNKFRTLTEAELRKMLIGFDFDVDKAVKVESAKYFRQTKCLSAFKIKNDKLIDYISLDFWNKENWKNIHNLTHILKNSEQQPNIFNEVTIAEKYVYYYVAELFCFTILQAVSDAIILNYADFDSAFTNCLYGGAEALNEKRRIHDAVNIATQQAAMFDAEWQADLLNISARFAQNTRAASQIPQLIQEIYEGSFYDDKVKIDMRLLKNYPDLTRKFTQDLFHFLQKNCYLNASIYSDFMEL